MKKIWIYSFLLIMPLSVTNDLLAAYYKPPTGYAPGFPTYSATAWTEEAVKAAVAQQAAAQQNSAPTISIPTVSIQNKSPYSVTITVRGAGDEQGEVFTISQGQIKDIQGVKGATKPINTVDLSISTNPALNKSLIGLSTTDPTNIILDKEFILALVESNIFGLLESIGRTLALLNSESTAAGDILGGDAAKQMEQGLMNLRPALLGWLNLRKEIKTKNF